MSLTTRELADRIDAELIGDGTRQVNGAAALGRTEAGDLSFFTQAPVSYTHLTLPTKA